MSEPGEWQRQAALERKIVEERLIAWFEESFTPEEDEYQDTKPEQN